LRPNKLADFLPISFDEFEGCVVRWSFHSTILEFRFVRQEDDQPTDYYDFWSYIDAITQGCKLRLIQFRRPRSVASTLTTVEGLRRSSRRSKNISRRHYALVTNRSSAG